jgi:hypothetical protein
MKSWQKRFFVCRDSKICYCYSDADHNTPSGEREMHVWMAVIRNNISALLNWPAPAAATLSVTKQPAQDVLYRGEACVDCGAPNPTWYSINWGVIIYIHCSGIQRSLTSTVSKVRSFTLDHLDAPTVDHTKG